MPTKNSTNMDKDKEDTSLVFQVLYTCGKNADVVKTAAISPNISILSNNIHDFTRHHNYFFRFTPL